MYIVGICQFSIFNFRLRPGTGNLYNFRSFFIQETRAKATCQDQATPSHRVHSCHWASCGLVRRDSHRSQGPSTQVRGRPRRQQRGTRNGPMIEMESATDPSFKRKLLSRSTKFPATRPRQHNLYIIYIATQTAAHGAGSWVADKT